MQTKKKIWRTPEEKELIILDYLNDKHTSVRKTADKHNVPLSKLKVWLKKYRELGIDGLVSQTGKKKHPGKGNHLLGLQRKKNKTREEELELENLKLKVEVARLKKGYQVKGVGSKKEYVTIKDLNTKS